MTRAIRVIVATKAAAPEQPAAAHRRDVHGWVVLDRSIGMASTHAVAVVKRLFRPSASRPCRHPRPARLRWPADRARSSARQFRSWTAAKISLLRSPGAGSAAPTIPRAGPSRPATSGPHRRGDTGAAAAVHEHDRLNPAAILAIRSRASAPVVARDGETVDLKPRPVEIHHLSLVDQPDRASFVFQAECLAGT